MDLRTGRTYETHDAAIRADVPPSDIVIVRLNSGQPIVKFSKGSFKSFVRNESGKLERVK